MIELVKHHGFTFVQHTCMYFFSFCPSISSLCSSIRPGVHANGILLQQQLFAFHDDLKNSKQRMSLAHVFQKKKEKKKVHSDKHANKP